MTATLHQASQILSLFSDKCFTIMETQEALGSGILTDVLESVKKGSLDKANRDDIRELLGLARLVSNLGENVHFVVIDYDQTLEEMIAAGHYDSESDYITHFSRRSRRNNCGLGKQHAEITLIHFNRVMSSDEAINEMDDKGYRPANIEELLALGREQPSLQREHPIIALGFFREIGGFRYVPYLGRNGSRRVLDIGRFNRNWEVSCRFAFIRK